MLDLRWTDDTIGRFQQLSEWAQKNRQLAQDMADNAGGSLLGRAVAGATLQLRDLTSGAAPVDTGTARSSHRADFRPWAEGTEGVVEIDPHAINPVNDQRPVYYGEIWADRYFNWFENIYVTHGNSVLDQMEQAVMTRIDWLWR